MRRWLITYDEEQIVNGQLPIFEELEELEMYLRLEEPKEVFRMWCEDAGITDPIEENFQIAAALIEKYEPKIDADNLLYELREDAVGEVGEDALSWLDSYTKPQLDTLNHMLNSALTEWLERFNQQPTFWRLVRVKPL